MNKRRHMHGLIFAVIAAAILLTPLRARASDANILTLDEVLRATLANNRVLVDSRLSGEIASKELGWAKSQRLPKFQLSYSLKEYGGLEPFAISIPSLGMNEVVAPAMPFRNSLGFKVTQFIYTGSRIEKGIEAASDQKKSAEADSAAQAADVLMNAIRTYWDLSTTRSAESTIRKSIEREEAHLKDTRNSYEAGLATKNDVLAAEVRLDKERLMLLQAENGSRLAAANLEYVASIAVGGREIEEPSSVEPAEPPPVEELVKKAQVMQPALEALQKQVEAARAGVAVERSAKLPQVYVSASADVARPNAFIIPPEEKWKPIYMVGVFLDWTIWDGKATDFKTAKARLRAMQAENRYAQQVELITLEVTRARLNLMNAAAKLKTARKGVERATENYQVSSDLYRSGLGTSSDVIDAHSSLLEEELFVVRAMAEIEVMKAELRRATGELYWETRRSKSPN